MTVLELLSPRERQAYCRRIFGARNCDIAAEMRTSPHCVSMLYKNARERIESGVPARQTVDMDRAREKETRENAIAREPRCRRCFLRGHVAGDPERCLPTVRDLIERQNGGFAVGGLVQGRTLRFDRF